MKNELDYSKHKDIGHSTIKLIHDMQTNKLKNKHNQLKREGNILMLLKRKKLLQMRNDGCARRRWWLSEDTLRAKMILRFSTPALKSFLLLGRREL
jgi:hypothetical protein